MPLCTIDYVSFAGGPGRTRRPRSAGSSGLVPIDSLSGSLTLGTTPFPLPAGWFASPLIVPAVGITPAQTFTLSFINIAGASVEGQTWFPGEGPLPTITPGTATVAITAVYLPEGGGVGGGDSGASIDAFDETTGTLVSDLFVTVAPDGGAQTSGNIDGWVDTKAQTETITALGFITDSQADFDRWLNLADPSAPLANGASFTAAKGESYYAFALYKAPPAPPPLDRCHSLAAETQHQIATIGALNIPIGVREETRTALLACEAELGAAVVNGLIAELFPPTPPPPHRPLPL